MAERTLTVKILGDASSARKALSSVDDGVAQSEGRFAKYGAAIKAAAVVGGVALFAFAKGSVDAFNESAKVGAQTEAVLKSTGGAAGVTAKEIGDLATKLQKLSGVEDEAIQAGQNMLLTFCLEESAQALVKGRGWTNHGDISPGDLILAYDPGDDSIRWEPVESMHRFDVAGDLIRWKSKQIDVATTPHHRWWTVASSGRSEWTPRFMTTAEISGRQVYVKIGGGFPEAFAPEPTYSDDLVELAGWVATEGWFVRFKNQSKRRGTRSCALCSQPARNRRGAARCDGCAKNPIHSGRSEPKAKVTAETSQVAGVSFCQSETANPLHVKRIRALVDRLRLAGHRVSETQAIAPYNDSTVISWYFAGDLGSTIRSMLPAKKLTVGLVESLTRQQASLLFDVLIAGDGHTDPHGHMQYIQKDPGQLDVLAILAAMLGRRSTVLGRGDSIYFPETNRLVGHQVNATPEHYEGVVWCPHLRTGVFLARNRGRTFWTGNTNLKNEAGAGNDVFNQATATLLDMSVALGTDAKTSAVQLGKALNDPIAGISALSRVGVTFTDEQKATIKTMVEMGDTAGAQKVILAELNKEFGGSAKAAGDAQSPMEKLSLRFGDLQEKVGGFLIPALEKLTVVGLGVIDFVSGLDPAVLGVIGVLAGLAVSVLAINKAIAAWTAVQLALHAVFWANPFVLAAAAIVALGAAIVLAYQHSETFRNIVQTAFGAVATAAGAMKDVAIGAIQFLVDKFLWAAEWIVKGAASAFGWVPGIGPKLKTAAREVEQFRDEVNASLGGIKDRNIMIRASYAGVSAADIMIGKREHGGPVTAGTPYIVGERRPELFVPSQNGTILPSVPSGGGGTVVNVSFPNYLGSKDDVVEWVKEALLANERRNGPIFAGR